MAKYRKIDPKIWNDEKFRSLSDRAKLVFLFGLTHPHLTAIGAMRATIPGLAAEMRWQPKAFRDAFQEAKAKAMVMVDEEASLIWFPRFLKYNSPESINVVKAWGAALEYLPECKLKDDIIQHVKAYADGLTDAFRDALPDAFRDAIPDAYAKAYGMKLCESENKNSKTHESSYGIHEQEQEQEHEQEQKNTDVSAGESVQDRIQNLLGLYHEKCPSLPKVKTCKPSTFRHRSLLIRIAEHGDDNFWPCYFAKVEASDFLTGREKKWRATFDWIMNPTNMTKILEGNYDNRDEPRPESGATAAEIEAARKARSKYS